MTFPAAVGICENDLRFDLTFLKEFAGPRVDLKVTPIRGGTLDAKTARLVVRQVEAMRSVGLPVKAVVVHHDVDRAGFDHRVTEIEKWYGKNRLDRLDLSLVVCAPDPCIERWLCILEGRVARNAKPSAGGDPWKRAWFRGRGIQLDRVRDATRRARQGLPGLPAFDRFFADWKAAGLEPR
jgi:hypothetical protein